jgi:hypothetical protein
MDRICCKIWSDIVIPVVAQLEPADFDEKVRTPGGAFLIMIPRPNTKEFERAPYWRQALGELYRAYGKICAYSAHWIPPDTGQPSVDHFIPKNVAPELAYEWSNFRLASLKMNSRKWTYQDVLDPFTIERDWFTLDFPSLLVMPNVNLSLINSEKVQATINRLRLNDDETCVEHRQIWVAGYCKGDITFDFLGRYAPFIAYELDRQNLRATISSLMNFN